MSEKQVLHCSLSTSSLLTTIQLVTAEHGIPFSCHCTITFKLPNRLSTLLPHSHTHLQWNEMNWINQHARTGDQSAFFHCIFARWGRIHLEIYIFPFRWGSRDGSLGFHPGLPRTSSTKRCSSSRTAWHTTGINGGTENVFRPSDKQMASENFSHSVFLSLGNGWDYRPVSDGRRRRIQTAASGIGNRWSVAVKQLSMGLWRALSSVCFL